MNEWKVNFKENNEGKAWVLGDDISTDDIISGKFLEIRDFDELSTHVFDSIIENFHEKMQPGDIIIAGNNFGYGSSREHAPFLLKYVGIGMICAKSFARIFFRNAINLGLPLFTVKDDVFKCFNTGDEVVYTIEPAKIINKTCNETHKLQSFPEFFMNIIRQGGALAALRRELE
ncbi:MAG: 3-isopropylmalate dehydratase small subunit [Candidatus Hodarchaeota archaeon]